MCSPLDTLIIPHFVEFVKRYFQLFFKPFVAKLCWDISLLTLTVYHTLEQNASGNVAQITGELGR